jgi:hypothetical protein
MGKINMDLPWTRNIKKNEAEPILMAERRKTMAEWVEKLPEELKGEALMLDSFSNSKGAIRRRDRRRRR